MTDTETAVRIAQLVKDAGGRAFFVGGCVRDRLLGTENKDIDIEVHGITPETLAQLLGTLGEVTSFGKSFGVFGLRYFGLDIAMPRSERAVGPGHQDFICTLDPFIGTRQAALRRDFTVNALMQDILTGEILDHFGGVADLENRLIRHIDDTRFAEDSLRVLRAAQFAARFGFTVAPETVSVCQRMDLSALSSERVFGELEKALLKADHPSVFFTVLREMRQLDCWFPEVRDLIGVPQPAEFHPEGDVWTHTMLVLDQAASLRGKAGNPLGLMLSALCHDLGKPAATRVESDGRLHSFGHDQEGVVVAERFLSRITQEKKLKQYVKNMVQLHMLPNMMAFQKAGQKAFNRLFDRAISPDDLLLLSRADILGCGSMTAEKYAEAEALLQDRLSAYQALMAQPGITGADLIAAGFSPGEAFREALSLAHQLQLSGVERDKALPQVLAFLRQTDKRPPA